MEEEISGAWSRESGYSIEPMSFVFSLLLLEMAIERHSSFLDVFK